MPSKNKTKQSKTPKLLASTVAKALEKHLLETGSAVYWVSAGVDRGAADFSSLAWPECPYYGYLVEDGSNEGTRLTVLHSYMTALNQVTENLLYLKYLGGAAEVFDEAKKVKEFIENMNLKKMLEIQG